MVIPWLSVVTDCCQFLNRGDAETVSKTINNIIHLTSLGFKKTLNFP